MMKRFRIVCFCCSVTAVTGWCQEPSIADSTRVLLGSQVHFGKILAHSRSIDELTDSYVWGFQTDVSRVRYTEDSWNTCNCYSQNGISISYFNYNNPSELGSSINLALFAEPQLSYSRMSLSFRAAAGISYLTRIYHPVDNPRNLFFSNPLSGLLLVQLSTRYLLNRHWRLRASASYSHISNGGRRQPNKGMNFPTFSLGLEYSKTFLPARRRQKISSSEKSLHYYGGISYNSRSVDESLFNSKERKMVIGLYGGLYKPFARMHAVGLGLEVVRDNALKERARRSGESIDHHVVSGLIKHHLLFGRFDFSQALGIYFYKDYPTPDKVFQRYAIYYKVLKKVQVGFSLKAHLYVAEQMDLRFRILF